MIKDIWRKIGKLCIQRGFYKSAERALLQSLKIPSQSAQDWADWALISWAREQLKDFPGALAAKDRSEESRPTLIRQEFIGAAGNSIAMQAAPAAKPEIISAAVDLKLTPAGKIQICEFNDLWCSNFAGYERLTQRDLQKDIVRPYYQSICANRPDFKLATGRLHADYFNLARTAPDDSIIFANSNLSFAACCSYKDYSALQTPDAAKPFFPETLVLPIIGNVDEISTEIDAAFGKDPNQLVVLKPTDRCQGSGVEILKACDLPLRWRKLQTLYLSDGGEFWQQNLHPNIIVQAYAPSQPVRAADGNFYNGTMRVAFTAIFDAQKTIPAIEFHGAYWKLPPKHCESITASADPKTIISASPGHLSNDAMAAFTNRPFSAMVSNEDRICVEKQLRSCLEHLLPAVVTPQAVFAEKILDLLNSPKTVDRGLAARLATHKIFGDYLLYGINSDYGQKLYDKIAELKNDARPSGEQYLLKLLTTPPAALQTARQYQAVITAANWLRTAPE